MGDRCGMSISADSPSDESSSKFTYSPWHIVIKTYETDETLNRGPLALLLRRQYEFPFGINIVQFSIFNMQFKDNLDQINNPKSYKYIISTLYRTLAFQKSLSTYFWLIHAYPKVSIK